MNRLITKLIVCIWVFSIASCGEDDATKPAESYQSILRSPAFAGITDSINRSPDNPELLLQRAIRLSQNDHHNAATPDYEKAYKLTGDEGIALEYTSNLMLANKLKEAVRVLQEGSKKFPENTEFSRRLAEIYMQNGQNDKAIAEYDHILSVDSSNFEALFDKGTLLLRLKDTTAAIQALERSFAAMPINHTGMALANIYVAKKDQRALEICDMVLQTDTAGVLTEPVYMKGVFYSEVKNYGKAVEHFNECIRRDWKMTDAYIEKGIIFYEQKNTDEALKVFHLASTVSNTDPDVYYWMGRCLEQKGNRQEAIVNYKRAIALDDTFTEAKDALRRLNS